MQQLNLTVTSSAQSINTTTAQSVPNNAQYTMIVNPSATATMAFTIDGSAPVINGNGVTIASLGAYTFSGPSGVCLPLSAVRLISSTATQAATVFYM